MDVVTVVVVVHSLVVVELVVVLVVVVWIVVVVAFSWKFRAKAMTTITPNRKRPTTIPIANLALSESDMMMTCRLQLKDQLTFKVMHCFLHVVHDQRYVHILKSIVSFIKINEFHSFDVTFIFFRNFGEFEFCVGTANPHSVVTKSPSFSCFSSNKKKNTTLVSLIIVII